MSKERLNAFSDGVIAIIITIMVLELKVPHGADWQSLSGLLPIFPELRPEFLFCRNLLEQPSSLAARQPGRQRRHHVEPNIHLLFWLSLIPFATGWMGENHFAELPTAVYGAALLMPALAYSILQICHCAEQPGEDRTWPHALGRDVKGNCRRCSCLAGIGLSFVDPRLGCAVYVLVAMMWFVPDRRDRKVHPAFLTT